MGWRSSAAAPIVEVEEPRRYVAVTSTSTATVASTAIQPADVAAAAHVSEQPKNDQRK
jgi:hypothetical protein